MKNYKLQVGDVVRWRTDAADPHGHIPHHIPGVPAGSILMIHAVGARFVMGENNPEEEDGFVVVQGPKRQLLWWEEGLERFDPRWFELDPFLTAVHRRRMDAHPK